MEVIVNSPNVQYSESFIESKYDYQFTTAERKKNIIEVTPKCESLKIRTQKRVPKTGVMLVGWGGNNGTTFTAAILANKLGLEWETRKGTQTANWYGSITQSSTVSLGSNINVQLSKLVPMLSPTCIEIDGWDISALNLADAMKRAQVLESGLQEQLKGMMTSLKPRPSVYDPDFIASNQVSRADNVMKGTKVQQVEKICQDIGDFKKKHNLEKVIILWTANTERYCDIIPNINDSLASLKQAIENNSKDISPSTLFAYSALKMNCVYINGSPQNTFVPGIVELAEKTQTFICGDDFKSGQTKIKSVLVDFLVSAGIKPTAIVSYNHLGNNDGKNLSEDKQFRSKEISKSNVVDDMVASNGILYKNGEKPNHVVVIKYVPSVGDSKRAMDEYTSEIMMGGINTLVIHNVCEDSLLATPIILDLIILSELFTRIEIKRETDLEFTKFHSVLSVLGYLLKAPLVPDGTPIINALFKQRACLDNILRACIGLSPESNMLLEHKLPFMMGPDLNKEQNKTEPLKKKAKLAL